MKFGSFGYDEEQRLAHLNTLANEVLSGRQWGAAPAFVDPVKHDADEQRQIFEKFGAQAKEYFYNQRETERGAAIYNMLAHRQNDFEHETIYGNDDQIKAAYSRLIDAQQIAAHVMEQDATRGVSNEIPFGVRQPEISNQTSSVQASTNRMKDQIEATKRTAAVRTAQEARTAQPTAAPSRGNARLAEMKQPTAFVSLGQMRDASTLSRPKAASAKSETYDRDLAKAQGIVADFFKNGGKCDLYQKRMGITDDWKNAKSATPEMKQSMNALQERMTLNLAAQLVEKKTGYPTIETATFRTHAKAADATYRADFKKAEVKSPNIVQDIRNDIKHGKEPQKQASTIEVKEHRKPEIEAAKPKQETAKAPERDRVGDIMKDIDKAFGEKIGKGKPNEMPKAPEQAKPADAEIKAKQETKAPAPQAKPEPTIDQRFESSRAEYRAMREQGIGNKGVPMDEATRHAATDRVMPKIEQPKPEPHSLAALDKFMKDLPEATERTQIAKEIRADATDHRAALDDIEKGVIGQQQKQHDAAEDQRLAHRIDDMQHPKQEKPEATAPHEPQQTATAPRSSDRPLAEPDQKPIADDFSQGFSRDAAKHDMPSNADVAHAAETKPQGKPEIEQAKAPEPIAEDFSQGFTREPSPRNGLPSHEAIEQAAEAKPDLSSQAKAAEERMKQNIEIDTAKAKGGQPTDDLDWNTARTASTASRSDDLDWDAARTARGASQSDTLDWDAAREQHREPPPPPPPPPEGDEWEAARTASQSQSQTQGMSR